MSKIESYEYAKKIYFGYLKTGFFRRILWSFWYLICKRWDWILEGAFSDRND